MGCESDSPVAAVSPRPYEPTASEIEMMMEDADHHRAGPVLRCEDGSLRVYYSGFNLTALAAHIARELANR